MCKEAWWQPRLLHRNVYRSRRDRWGFPMQSACWTHSRKTLLFIEICSYRGAFFKRWQYPQPCAGAGRSWESRWGGMRWSPPSSNSSSSSTATAAGTQHTYLSRPESFFTDRLWLLTKVCLTPIPNMRTRDTSTGLTSADELFMWSQK